MAEDTTRTSNRKLNSGASEYNAISFMMEQQMKGSINTCIPVRVESCTKPGPNGAAGYVSVTPLVMQRGADGNSLAPVALPKLPFFRLYAGTAAVVIDPQPGDVGLAVFSQQDASNLEAGKNEPVQAGSFRSFDMSDGFYIGGFLGVPPDVYAELEQDTGINLKTPTNTITIGRDDGTITIKANTEVKVDAPIAKCTGDVEIEGTLKTGGLATFQQGLQTAAGTNATIGGSLTAAHDISAGGDFSGSGGMSLGGNASFGGTMDVTGAATFGGSLDATGAATFGGTMDVTGTSTFGGTMTVTGAATFDDVTVDGDLTTASIVVGTPQDPGELVVTGDITATGDLTAANATIGTRSDPGVLYVTGDAYVVPGTNSGTGTLNASYADIGKILEVGPDNDRTVIDGADIRTGSISATGTVSGSTVSGNTIDGTISGSSITGNISVGAISATGLSINGEDFNISMSDGLIECESIRTNHIRGNQGISPYVLSVGGILTTAGNVTIGGSAFVHDDVKYGGTIGPYTPA